MTHIELLAPARDKDTAIAAILHGADAVYIGGPGHGARQRATNSVDDIAEVVTFAHGYGARVYVTLNTLLLDDEVDGAIAMAWQLYRTGVDALIIQDMALLNDAMPPIELHASTQCDIRTGEKAIRLAAAGCSRLVLPREMSCREIQTIARAVPTTGIEAFVHGALCVSFSGDCQAGQVACGRSGNRGACPQMCRLSYDLTDADGNVLARNRHLLSLKDMCRLDYLQPMLEAGVTSFKIEGRLKDANYVKNVVAAYSERLDAIIAGAPDKYCRASLGRSHVTFVPDVQRSFNRSFTPYFLDGGRPKLGSIVSFDTPKAMGAPIGTVKATQGRVIEARLTTSLANGDGLSWIDARGNMQGIRVNRAEGLRLICSSKVDIAPGTLLLRTNDKAWENLLKGPTATRTIPLRATLRQCPDGRMALGLTVPEHPRSHVIVYSDDAIPGQQARTPQRKVRYDLLGRLGDTIYTLDSLDDDLADECFIPASVLVGLRRKALASLERQRRITWHHGYRRGEQPLTTPESLTYHDNVANEHAAAWYRRHGTMDIEPALEARPQPGRELRVMTTRHCIRREMCLCPKDNPGASAGPLYLVRGAERWRLNFQCRECLMHVTALPSSRK